MELTLQGSKGKEVNIVNNVPYSTSPFMLLGTLLATVGSSMAGKLIERGETRSQLLMRSSSGYLWKARKEFGTR